MKIDGVSMLIEEATPQEQNQLYHFACDLLLTGHVNQEYVTKYFKPWAVACALDGRQELLTMCTVFPARVFLSLLRLGFKAFS